MIPQYRKALVASREAQRPTREEYRTEHLPQLAMVKGLVHLEGLGHKVASCPKCHICRYEDEPYDMTELPCYDCAMLVFHGPLFTEAP